MGVDDDSTAGKPKPTIQVPPRASMEFLFTNGSFPGFSPGPMTLVSNLFPEQGQFSFSQLLAGAMVSPLGAKTGSLSTTDSDKEQKKEGFSEDVSGGGIKRNRPANLVVPPPLPQLEGLSPLFLFPPGMSPSGLLNSPGILSPLQSPFGMSHQQVLAHVTAQAALSSGSFKQLQPEYQPPPPSTHPVEVTAGHLSLVPIATLAQPTNGYPQEPESSKVESSVVSSSEKSTTPYVGGSSKPAGDGYNWRKYGQKHVKASECPRSYYKCTYYNCPVKKKVELSVDGQVCGITYKGQHNHDPPQSSKRGKDSSSADRTVNSQAKPELGIVQYSSSEFARLQPSTLVASNRKVEETAVAAHLAEDEEPMTKRRSMDSGASIPASSLQTVTESKIVLQTRSEVDLLDDGYRWRKYGQKVVKGNPYPRSYYRCTYAGCNVRKHVERASSDPKSVITTYEGKHNHDLPTGKNSHRVASDASSLQLQAQAQTQKSVSRNPSSPNEDRLENKDGIPVTYNKL